MEKLTVLILAAGQCRRWEGVLKQLLVIGGETLIERQIRQVRARAECDITVVTHAPEIALVAHELGAESLVPEARRCTSETLLSSKKLWGERTLILLGDVVFSWFAMETIFAHEGDATVFGNELEIYAVAFNGSERKKVAESLKKVAAGDCDEANGKMRHFWWRHFDPPEIDPERPPKDDPNEYGMVWIRDYTKDFDFPGEYKNFVMRVEMHGMLNDTLERGP